MKRLPVHVKLDTSKIIAGIKRAKLPTSICRPTTIRTLPFDDVAWMLRAAMARAVTPMMQRMIPLISTPLDMREPMISVTPKRPVAKPIQPTFPSRSPNKRAEARPTIRGMAEAMMEAREASILCIAMKNRPRYSAFWQMPKMITACQFLRSKWMRWPSA